MIVEIDTDNIQFLNSLPFAARRPVSGSDMLEYLLNMQAVQRVTVKSLVSCANANRQIDQAQKHISDALKALEVMPSAA